MSGLNEDETQRGLPLRTSVMVLNVVSVVSNEADVSMREVAEGVKYVR